MPEKWTAMKKKTPSWKDIEKFLNENNVDVFHVINLIKIMPNAYRDAIWDHLCGEDGMTPYQQHRKIKEWRHIAIFFAVITLELLIILFILATKAKLSF